MSLKTALVYHLKNDDGVSALVGARVFPQFGKEGIAYPYIVFNRVSTARHPEMEAASGLVSSRVQIDVWDNDPLTAQNVAEAVRAALDGYTNTTMGSGDHTCAVHRIMLDGQRDTFSPPLEGKEDGAYGEQLDFVVIHTESVPTFD